MLKNITVFGCASSNFDKKYYEAAFRMGQLIGENGMRLVFGIGDDGLMGQVFRGALHKHAEVLGITTPPLYDLQCHDKSVFKDHEVQIVSTLSERKHRMYEIADAMIVLPGGWGTIDEFAEFSVTAKIREIALKPMIFLNTDGFWEYQRKQLEVMCQTRAISATQFKHVGFADEPEDVLPLAARIQNALEEKN